MTEPIDKDSYSKPGSKFRVALRRQFVLDMRLAGFRYPQITELWNRKCEREGWEDLRTTSRTIRKDGRTILMLMRQRESERSESLRTLLTLRYETALTAIQAQIRNGNLAAIKTMIQINRAIAELHGLTNPVVMQTNQTTNVLVLTEEERARRVADLLAAAHERAQLAGIEENDDENVIDGDLDADDHTDLDDEDDDG